MITAPIIIHFQKSTRKLTKSNVAIADYLAYEEEQLEPWAKAQRLGYC
jgi:hypothetical protein